MEKYCGYGFLSDREGSPILMSLLGNMDVEGKFDFKLQNKNKTILLCVNVRKRDSDFKILFLFFVIKTLIFWKKSKIIEEE